MRTLAVSIAVLSLLLPLPASAAKPKLVDAPPPPPIPDNLPDENVAPPKADPSLPLGLGQVLYESGCTSCHESVVRVGTRATVKSLPDLREQVARRATDARLQWRQEELDAVVRYLAVSRYRFQQP